uniref:Transmembrane protein n=1 Tax=Parascaris equorum TaxID=6256 RepID=A0A914RNW9_PAREQ
MRHEQLYPGCCGQEFYIDISFDILLRRKTLFYTVNLVIPCMLIGMYFGLTDSFKRANEAHCTSRHGVEDNNISYSEGYNTP